MKKLLLAGALAFGFTASAANAQITVDGAVDAAYGDAKSTVVFNPAAPTSNFGAPTNLSETTNYSIYLAALEGGVFGALQADGATAIAGSFSNLYFDLNPGANNGSDLGFEIQNDRAFIPGRGGYSASLGIEQAISADGFTVEFFLPNNLFTTAIAGLNYYDDGQPAALGDTVRLQLSQSFGFSVNGGLAFYGADRLGTVELAAAGGVVPEPATWAMMIVGVGAVGGAMRRRRVSTRVSFA